MNEFEKNMEELKRMSLEDLRKLAYVLQVDNIEKKSRPKLLSDINDKLESKTRRQTHKSHGQLGVTGKEGTTHLIKRRGKEYAKKMFKDAKSPKTLEQEVNLQQIAARSGISPKIIEYDLVDKYILMEKLDNNLYDVLKKNGSLSSMQQQQMIKILKKLDNIGIFHADPNPLNFMEKNGQMYIIDYGFAKQMTPQLVKKYKTDKPNMRFMITGFILRLREINPEFDPSVGCPYLLGHVPDEDRTKFGW